VTIPEDNAKLNMGMMVLGLDLSVYQNALKLTTNPLWYTDSLCSLPISSTNVPTGAAFDATIGPLGALIVGSQLSDEPVLSGMTIVTLYQQSVTGLAACVKTKFVSAFPTGLATYPVGMDLLSQHKMLATLNGVPTKPDYLLCEIVEKEKAKIPPQSTKSPSKRQFPDEIIKTTLQDVTSNFVCKFRTIKAGVYALDVYFIGPQIAKFIADHMLIVTVGYKVGKQTIWASDLQDICILGWSMDQEVLAISLFLPYGLSTGSYSDTYYSWPNPMNGFVSCDEAAAWQLAWINGGWPYSTN
jgi:hypothetical protein